MHYLNSVKSLTVLGILLLVTACSGIPKQEFESYLGNFDSAKNTTQDIILALKLIVESDSNSSHEQQILIQQKIEALDARLAALDLISKYNNVLVRLASGRDPEAVKGSLDNLSNGLNSFGSANLNSLISDVTPYSEIIAQAVTLIDNAIKKKKFREAVAAAHKPIQGIIEILQHDADDLFEIQAQTLGKKLDPERHQIIDLRFDFQDFVNTLDTNYNIDSAISRFNTVLKMMKASPSKLPDQIIHMPTSPHSANANDYSLLKVMINQTMEHIAKYNNIRDQVYALANLELEYKKVLVATSDAFNNLNFAIQNKQRMLPIDFTVDVLNLRKAYLKLQEAKQK